MASITACSKNLPDRLRAGLLVLLFAPLLAWAAAIEIGEPQLMPADDGYVLSADFRFELNPRLEEAVNRGVALYFVAEFELTRDRWYWLDTRLASRRQVYRLSYHALTRQYRLSTGGLHQSFDTLTEALRVLRRLRQWVVVERGDKTVQGGEPYEAALRLYLDVTQLPRPFQISALGNKDWTLESAWVRWPVILPATPVSTGDTK